MSMYDFDSPNKSKISLSDLNLNSSDIYYVSFLHNGIIYTRTVKLIDKAFRVLNGNWSKTYRIESDWVHLYFKKVSVINDGLNFKQLLTPTNELPKNELVSVDFISDSVYGFDCLDLSLVGRSPDESILRFISLNINNCPDEFTKILFQSELEYYTLNKPSLFDFVLNNPLPVENNTSFVNIKKYFLYNNKDISNDLVIY